ncbi:roadblock/LC7 domain-containing protein [Desulfobotulus sp. H1]|uniref:Roadblock/LC7 domain-containing protein n=1 Tax=Desulfobotulus pelophilus TaxID=2823377 RepID=A0ABT3NCD3_9BACT|nr:roadblock/LC7 domain-containing protein [Desulfobotulus pelophilus]MCW7755136.1 roadblock/LC7 domain-containing protein [Desulfobotulus pelophilus]
MDFTLDLDKHQLEKIEKILDEELIDLGVSNVILLDLAGNVIVNLDNGNTQHDVYSLAALAAGNFGAVSAMANLIGEQEFSLLFHKGETDSIHFSKVTDDLLLLSIFGKEVSLGFLRLKVSEAVRKIESLFG